MELGSQALFYVQYKARLKRKHRHVLASDWSGFRSCPCLPPKKSAVRTITQLYSPEFENMPRFLLSNTVLILLYSGGSVSHYTSTCKSFIHDFDVSTSFVRPNLQAYSESIISEPYN